MGEIADDILNGDMCQFCGQVFIEEGFGVPRTCYECLKEGMEDPNEGLGVSKETY